MTQVGITGCAKYLGAYHAMSRIPAFDDGAGDGLPEAGPAATSVEFGGRNKQRRGAADAAIGTVGGGIPVDAAEGWLGMGVAGHAVLRFIQLSAPFGIGFAYFGHGGFLGVYT